jgi:hypothetical protein
VLDLAITVCAVTSMLSVGLRYTVPQLAGPLRNVREVLRALVANFVLVPLLALLIARLVRLDQPYAVGLIVVAAAAAAPSRLRRRLDAARAPRRGAASAGVEDRGGGRWRRQRGAPEGEGRRGLIPLGKR